MWLLNLNFKGSRLAFWKESKKDLVWNSGNPESDSSSQLAVIFTKELEVSYKRKVQTYRKSVKVCESQIKVLEVEPDLPFTIFFLRFSPVSHRDQMKDSEIMYYRIFFFFHLGEGNFLEDFLLFLLGLFGFAFCFVFCLFGDFCIN